VATTDRAFTLGDYASGSVRWAKLLTSRGRTAVAVFSSRKKAAAFRQAMRLEGPWRVTSMTGPGVLDWLRRMMLQGTPFVTRDPSPGHLELCSIFRLLVDIEA
jgi:hypothetical protein